MRSLPITRAAARRRSATASTPGAADKDRPLIDDIRLLGRLLGDVIHDAEGSAAFELVERVRQLSVAYRRRGDADVARTLQSTYVCPVLTAHPTEVQRQSILRAGCAIADLIAGRDDLASERARADNEALPR